MKIYFSKYHGTGNDFILIDDPDSKINLTDLQIERLCDRRFGIGADGLILMRKLDGYDFQMVYFNSDGNESSMCGNGGRCITAFARSLGRIGDYARFSAVDGDHEALITGFSPLIVKLKMGDVHEIENETDYIYMNTGSPHYVKFVEDVSHVDVVAEGRKIRNSGRFLELGTNVNFVQALQEQLIVRTYERGVEDETLSCGTGVTAAALAAVLKNKMKGGKEVVRVLTPGGNLNVYFEKDGSGFHNVWLEGGASFVYHGEIEL